MKHSRQAIERATAAFLAQGGSITQCTPQDNAAAHERTLNRRENLTRRKQRDWVEKNNHRAKKAYGPE